MTTRLAQEAEELRPTFGQALKRGIGPVLAAVGFVLLMHFVIGPAAGPFYGKVLNDVGIAIVLAVSLNIVNGFTGQFSIGHAAFMAMGGYTAACITYYGSFWISGSAMVQPGLTGQLFFLFACLVGGLTAAVAGFFVGLPSLRLRGDYLAIVTLGFGEIMRVMLQRSEDVLFQADAVAETPWYDLATKLGGSLGFTGVPFYTNVFWVYTFVVIVLVVSYRLKTSTFGRAFLAIRENEIAAEAMGVNTTKYKVRAFVIAAFFAGIAGALFAHLVGTTLNPRELGFQKSFDLVIMVVLGGMGSISGTTIAAIILTVLPEALRGFSEYRMIVYAILLIAMMLWRPRGLLGLNEVWELPVVKRLIARFRR